MRISSAALLSFQHANHADEDFTHTLSGGDLHQMGTQYDFLRARGFVVGFRDVYPALKTEEERTRAMKALYDNGVAGWWNMRYELVKAGICTEQEFLVKLEKL